LNILKQVLLWLGVLLVLGGISLVGIRAQAGNSPFLRTHVGRADVPVHLLGGGSGQAQVMLQRELGLSSASLSYISGTRNFRVRPHIHAESDELLYVLKGGGRLQLGDRTLDLLPEMAVWIPKGVVHSFVAGPRGIEAVQVYSPGGPEQRFLKAPVLKD
jgi:quercetin dioxygenase-like cupin family protein